MKIPTKKIDLTELGYDGYWIEMPRSVKEGFVQELAGAAQTNGDGNSSADAEAGRRANVKILELVTAWNLDDDAGKVLPLFSTLKTEDQKRAILAELPIDVLVHVAQNLTSSTPENVKDFSNRS